MSIARRRVAGLRLAALLGFGALALHQLRYLAGYGNDAEEALATQGHGYVDLLLPVLVCFGMALLAGLLLAAALARPARDVTGPPSVRHPLACALVLVAIFCFQELVEGALSAGHPNGLEALVGHRGWVALPLATVLGGLVSLALTGLGTLEHRIAGAFVGPRLRSAPRLGGRCEQPCVRRPAGLVLEPALHPRPPPSAPVG